jgi:hypothetical protein
VTYLDEITRTHLLALEAYVRRKGNSPLTAYNHMVSVGTFLRHFGFGGVLKKRDLPRYTPKVPIAYSPEELRRLFAAASPEDRLLFEFFLGTGGANPQTATGSTASPQNYTAVVTAKDVTTGVQGTTNFTLTVQ